MELLEAAREYEAIWASDGGRIIQTMESVSGLAFGDDAIRVIVFEGVSSSGLGEQPMRLRASYPRDTKRATLIHELGPRLQAGLRRPDEDQHALLALWLSEVWESLYGPQFVVEQVAIEKQRGGPYPQAWDDALSISRTERRARWNDLVMTRR